MRSQVVALGRAKTRNRPGRGYTHTHTAIDAYSRLAYSEFADIENTQNRVAFLDRATAWFATQGITTERILTDNGVGHRSAAWRDRCGQLDITHARTPDRWLHRYNHHRHHTAIGGPPASRVNNLPTYNT